MQRSGPVLPVCLTQFLPAVLLSLAVMVLAAPPCSAQGWGTVEISPVVGAYLPSADLPPLLYPCAFGVPCSSSHKQSSAIAVGGRATAWVNKRVAVQGSLWYSPSSVTGSGAGPADIAASDLRVVLRLVRGPGTWAYVSGGPAFIDRLGAAYAGFTGTASLGGVVGVGAHLRLARSLALRADLEHYLYSYRGYRQQDFVVSVGLSLASRIGSAATP